MKGFRRSHNDRRHEGEFAMAGCNPGSPGRDADLPAQDHEKSIGLAVEAERQPVSPEHIAFATPAQRRAKSATRAMAGLRLSILIFMD
jgi:hypothetical protein